jgi:hypothetical protein
MMNSKSRPLQSSRKAILSWTRPKSLPLSLTRQIKRRS